MTVAAQVSTRTAVAVAGALVLVGCIPPGSGPSVHSSRYEMPRPQSPAAPRTVPNHSAERPAAPPPAASARPARAEGRTVAESTYTVVPGDTLEDIASRTGAGAPAIIRTNQMVSPYILHPGQQIAIPGGLYHTVRDGETGASIARAYSVAWPRLREVNGLEEGEPLRAGDRLLIPDRAAR